MSAVTPPLDLATELRREARDDLRDAARMATTPADLRGWIRICVRSGVDPDEIRTTVAIVNAELGAHPDLFDDSHRDEYARLGRPVEPHGLRDYADLCRTLRAHVDADRLSLGDALEMTAQVARNVGIPFDTACELALMHLMRPGTGKSRVSDEDRLEFAARVFDRGWGA